MNKKDLEQLRHLQTEKRNLEKKAKQRKFTPSEIVADTAKDYRTGYGKTIVISGYGDPNWQKLQIRYAQKVAAITSRIRQMEDFLDSVQDAEMRTILRMRYEDGMTQEQVGEELGYSRQAIQKKEERFWSKL